MIESFDLYMILKREPYEFQILLVEISGRALCSQTAGLYERGSFLLCFSAVLL